MFDRLMQATDRMPAHFGAISRHGRDAHATFTRAQFTGHPEKRAISQQPAAGIDPHPPARLFVVSYATPPAPATVMDALVSLCKRRGFIYPSSEIYGGLNGFFDYGPLGRGTEAQHPQCLVAGHGPPPRRHCRPRIVDHHAPEGLGGPPAMSPVSPIRWSTARSPSSVTAPTSCFSPLSPSSPKTAHPTAAKNKSSAMFPRSKASARPRSYRRKPRP